jgi:hypothetical protein
MGSLYRRKQKRADGTPRADVERLRVKRAGALAGEDRDTILSTIRDDAEDMAQARGDAGYLLGVAVGQQIGPNAVRTERR